MKNQKWITRYRGGWITTWETGKFAGDGSGCGKGFWNGHGISNGCDNGEGRGSAATLNHGNGCGKKTEKVGDTATLQAVVTTTEKEWGKR